LFLGHFPQLPRSLFFEGRSRLPPLSHPLTLGGGIESTLCSHSIEIIYRAGAPAGARNRLHDWRCVDERRTRHLSAVPTATISLRSLTFLARADACTELIASIDPCLQAPLMTPAASSTASERLPSVPMLPTLPHKLVHPDELSPAPLPTCPRHMISPILTG
jgi:hypothetical protein